MNFLFRNGRLKTVLLSLGLGTSIFLEYNIYYYKKLIREIKKTKVFNLSDQASIQKIFPLQSSHYLLSGIIKPSNELTFKMPIYLRETPNFILENNHILVNSFAIKFINPRKFTIERLFLPISFCLDVLFSLFDKTSQSSSSQIDEDRLYRNLKFSDYFRFFLAGDHILMFGENTPERINKFSNGTLILKPNIVIQGTKTDLIRHFTSTIEKINFEKSFIEYPLITYFVGKITEYFLKKIVHYYYYRKKEIPKEGEGSCSKCRNKHSSIICKNCNYFKLCEECFKALGSKCPNCSTENPKIVIITN